MPDWQAGPDRIYPANWRLKSDVPQPYTAKRVNFGIHGWAWCAFYGSQVLVKTGAMIETHEARLHTGWVIGPCDLAACGENKHAEGWRQSLADRRLGR